MPCSPDDISINPPDGPSGPAIGGFGVPFSLKVPDLNPFPAGFPEDLNELFNNFKFTLPSGIVKPSLNLNFSKDIFDSIMSLMDKFFPFLMMYKFFLPFLNIILCILEVLCALANPFKIVGALIKLFTKCLPEFLAIFPIFALIIMIISLLLLIIALIGYIVSQILKFVNAILRNISALTKAFQEGSTAVLAIAKKIGALMCIFKNLFVLLAVFGVIIQVIKDMLLVVFGLPPCSDSDPDGCCTTDVCPEIVKNPYTRTTGTLQYLNKVGIETDVVLPPPFNFLNVDIRSESWQIYDEQQLASQKFYNIIDAPDVPGVFPFKPIFFPTDSLYTSITAPKQAAYTVDLRLLYNPSDWGRTGAARNIRIKDCIVTTAPTLTLTTYNNLFTIVPNGVMKLAGGRVFEDDGTTVITGFDTDGVTPITDPGTLENFLHQPAVNSAVPVFNPTDGHTFSGNVEYSFKPNLAVLVGKELVTAGCVPALAINKTFINNAVLGDFALKTQLLSDLVNGRTTPDGNVNVFPDPNAAIECLDAALTTLSSNLTPEGVAQFQSTADICLNKLKDDTNSALSSLVGIGIEPCQSEFSVNPSLQFTSKTIQIKVDLKEKNGLSLTAGLSEEAGASLASKIKAYPTLGTVDNFVYDGVQFFTANINSTDPGDGYVMISFDNNIFCTDNIPVTVAVTDLNDISNAPNRDLDSVSYKFILTPSSTDIVDGKPRRDEGDVSRDNNHGGD